MPNFTTSHAFIIGINDYQELTPLQTAVNDAEKLAGILQEEHGFKVDLHLNPNAQTIRELLQNLPNIVTSNDRVLFYFAGHGVAMDSEEGQPQGYLLPVDAQKSEIDRYIAMGELHQTFAALECRHFLLILDCCFSGAFKWSSGFRKFQFPPKKIYKERYDQYIQDPAWQVITSSAYNEEALDVAASVSKALGAHGSVEEDTDGKQHSPFALALFDGLKGGADVIPKGGDGIITASELYLHLREAITQKTIDMGEGTDRHRQTPSIFPLTKHDRGEFIFLTDEFNYDELPSLEDMQLNPYRGLEAYRFGKQEIKSPDNDPNKKVVEYEDKDFFYGRDEVVEDLQNHLQNHSLLVMTGASGTGKSSVIKAGVLPKMQENGYTILLPIVRPGTEPLKSLQAHIGRNTTELQNSILVIDQYEELITQCQKESDRLQFIQHLKRLLESNIPNFKIILTIRSDFEPQFDRLILGDEWQAARKVVPPFKAQELRDIILQPAAQRILHFEPPELVQQIIDEVQQAPGALPLLSFLLSELYQVYLKEGLPKGERSLNQSYYEKLGYVQGALRTRADEIYAKMDTAHQKTMQKVMLRMVSQEGGELAGKRVFEEELKYPSEEENERVKTIIKKLVKARLVVQGKDEQNKKNFIEPAHDALVRAWGELSNWITQVGEYRLGLFSNLQRDVQQYHAQNSQKAYLWHENPRLEEVNLEREEAIALRTDETTKDIKTKSFVQKQWELLFWNSEKPVHQLSFLNRIEDVFVQRSNRQKSRGQRVFVLSIVGVILVLSVMLTYALVQQNEAVKQAERAEAQTEIAQKQQKIAEEQKDTAEMNLAKTLNLEIDKLIRGADVYYNAEYCELVKKNYEQADSLAEIIPQKTTFIKTAKNKIENAMSKHEKCMQ